MIQMNPSPRIWKSKSLCSAKHPRVLCSNMLLWRLIHDKRIRMKNIRCHLCWWRLFASLTSGEERNTSMTLVPIQITDHKFKGKQAFQSTWSLSFAFRCFYIAANTSTLPKNENRSGHSSSCNLLGHSAIAARIWKIELLLKFRPGKPPKSTSVFTEPISTKIIYCMIVLKYS